MKKIAILSLLLTQLFVSCDKDFNEIGTDIIGDENFDLTNYDGFQIEARNEALKSIQTNNLPVNALGIFHNPVFGTTRAHFVSQIELETTNPNLGNNPQITSKDSVYMYIPYYSTLEETDSDGNRTYRLDSLYSNINSNDYSSANHKFKLKIYRSETFLTDATVSGDNQVYYNNHNITHSSQLNTDNSNNNFQNDNFFFDNSEIKFYRKNSNGEFKDANGAITTDPSKYVVKERKAPGMWIALDKTLFGQVMLDGAANGKLFNNNIFKDYFKGLYFHVEENSSTSGALAYLDFSRAEIILQYHATSDNATTATKRNLEFRMGYNSSSGANSINILETANQNSIYESAIQTNSATNTGAKLFVKGGSGSISVLKINFDANELANLRTNTTIINEAVLTFYVDQSGLTGLPINNYKEIKRTYEPERLLVYNYKEKRMVIDYNFDTSTAPFNKFNKFIFGGILERDKTTANWDGNKYQVRITEELRDFINNTSDTELELAVSVTGTVNSSAFGFYKNDANEVSKNVLFANGFEPLGTVLHGIDGSAKQLKLKIYYTKPN